MTTETAAPAAESAPSESTSEVAPVESTGQLENLSDSDVPTATASESEGDVDVVAETAEELQDEIGNAIEEGATEKEVNKMVETFKLKVHGKEIEKTLDWEDKESIKRDLQIAEANKGGMARARELEKLYEQEITRLRNNPWDVLQELGLDPMDLAEGKINEYIEEKKKSPEQIEKETMQKELEAARAELKRQKEVAEQENLTRLQEQEAVKLETEIDTALNSHTDLPNSRKTVSRIADALFWAMDNGFPNASVEDVIPMVKQDIQDEMNEFMNGMPEDMMERYIGKKNIERLREQRLAKVKASKSAKLKASTAQPAAKSELKEKISAKQFFKNPLNY